MENKRNIQRNLPLLVLASSSPRRKELIKYLGLPVEISPSGAEENIESQWSAAEAVEQLALLKAKDVASLRESSAEREIVIGADTVVVYNETILGKPKDEADAVRMLSMLQGQPHEVYTGVACIDVQTGLTVVRHRRTQVWMRALSEAQIARYVATGEPMDKAGSYGIQGYGAAIVDRIEGCFFNVVGLPVSLLVEMVKEYGVEAP